MYIDIIDVNSRFKDDLADGGFPSKGYFYGYKLHLIVTRDGVSLTTVLIKANLTEALVNEELTDKLDRSLTKKQRERLRNVVADAGYDSNRIYEVFQQLDMEMIAAVNPRRDGRLKEKELSRKTKRELKERGKVRDLGILGYHTQRGRNSTMSGRSWSGSSLNLRLFCPGGVMVRVKRCPGGPGVSVRSKS